MATSAGGAAAATAEEETIAALADVGSDDDTSERRAICFTGCGRPPTVCLCPYLPPSPLPTTTSLVVLSHPHELRRRNALATAPLLPLALSKVSLLAGRRLRPGMSTLLDSPPRTILFLFPSPSAPTLAQWARVAPPSSLAAPLLVLVDGTWRQAREMATASLPFLSSLGAVTVSLDFDVSEEGGSGYDSDLLLRKEPYRGCVSTFEAVARALRVLEPEPYGTEVEERLLVVLRAAARFQSEHLPTMKPRVKAQKKNMKKHMNKDGGDT